MQLDCDLWRAIDAPDVTGGDSAPTFSVGGREEEDSPVFVSNPDPERIPFIPVEEVGGRSSGM